MRTRVPIPPHWSVCVRMMWFSHSEDWSGGERKTECFSMALCTWKLHLLCLAGLHERGCSCLFHGLSTGRLGQGLSLVRTTRRLHGLPLAGPLRERMQRAFGSLGPHAFPLTYQAITTSQHGETRNARELQRVS